jgi:hypothetical protein
MFCVLTNKFAAFQRSKTSMTQVKLGSKNLLDLNSIPKSPRVSTVQDPLADSLGVRNPSVISLLPFEIHQSDFTCPSSIPLDFIDSFRNIDSKNCELAMFSFFVTHFINYSTELFVKIPPIQTLSNNLI